MILKSNNKEHLVNRSGKIYYLSFSNAPKIPKVQSKEFTVTKLHFQVTKLQKMKVWFGEDLQKSDDQNNGGRVCADVYANLRGNVSHFLKKHHL